MTKDKKKRKGKFSSKPFKSSKSDTLAAEAYRLKADEIIFEETASREAASFMDNAVLLFGPVKIGKSTFGSFIPDVYFLPTEIGYRFIKVRKTPIPNWVTFMKFVQKMEKSPRFVKTVSMWCIDTVDNLSMFCAQYACGRAGIGHPSDQEWGKGWDAIRDEWMHWILRLGVLGPGVLFISHERERDVISHGSKVTKVGPTLVKSHYTAINNMCDIMMRMGCLSILKHTKSRKRRRVKSLEPSQELTGTRCLFTKPTEAIDAGDRTGMLPDIIYFDTEKEAVNKLLKCFAQKGIKKKRKR